MAGLLCEHHLEAAWCVPTSTDALTSDRKLRLKMLPMEHSSIIASLDENWRTVVEIRSRLGGRACCVSQLAAGISDVLQTRDISREPSRRRLHSNGNATASPAGSQYNSTANGRVRPNHKAIFFSGRKRKKTSGARLPGALRNPNQCAISARAANVKQIVTPT